MEKELLKAQMPKKPLNPKLKFSKLHYKEFKEKDPTKPFKDIQKDVFQAYDDLPAPVKRIFTDAYDQERATYERDTALFVTQKLEEIKRYKVLSQNSIDKYLKIFRDLDL